MRNTNVVRRLLAAAALAFSLMLVSPGLATAAPAYPAPKAKATVSPSTTTPNKTVKFRVTGFKGSESIRVTERYRGGNAKIVRKVRVTKQGSITIHVKFKKTGTATLTAMAADNKRFAQAVVKVVKR
jgi:hypothetical protein